MTESANENHPTLRNGKICYLEMPAVNIETSASFYKTAFGWNTRPRGDGAIAFDDTVGEVSGTWVLGRKPMIEVGLLVYITVDSAAPAIAAGVAKGRKVVHPIGADAPEMTAQ